MKATAAATVQAVEQRTAPRVKVPAMYTLMRARLVGEERYRWTGHIYEVSLDGMRFELDEALQPGTAMAFRAMLPGRGQVMFRASGRVVRLLGDEPALGPVRMGMHFERFASVIDRRRLADYLTSRVLADRPVRRAA